ncbi:ComEC/Rec2 family competence protein [Treponema sp. R80B11-R83G3]
MVIKFLKRLPVSPVLCTALGAVIGFYILFHAVLPVTVTVLLFFIAVFNFLMVLSSLDTQSRALKLYSLCAAVLAVGTVIGICAASAGQNKTVFGLPEAQITGIEGVLLEDPRIISGGKAIVTVSLRKCAAGSASRAIGSGEITVFFSQESAEKLKHFGRGTVVFAEGPLRSSERGNSGRSWSVSAKSLHVVEPPPPIERMRTGIRLNLIKRFSGKPWGGLALALLLGIKDNLDTELAVMYRNSGLSYILALSGMHLAILAALITFLFKKPLGLKASAICGAAIILLYCFLVGSMPSLNRAAMMYILGVLAVIGALPRKPMSILSLSFIIQIIVTPSAGNSISFILSYLALVGILIIGKPLSSLFAGKAPDILLQPLAMSCGAFLATAGVCGSVFGILAPIGIITGLVMVPLTTVFMIGSIIWLVLDFISLSAFLNWPLSVLYRLMEIIASVSAKVPGISKGAVLIIILSLFLSILIIAFEHRRRLSLLRPEPFL